MAWNHVSIVRWLDCVLGICKRLAEPHLVFLSREKLQRTRRGAGRCARSMAMAEQNGGQGCYGMSSKCSITNIYEGAHGLPVLMSPAASRHL